jgi:uncharacterized protein YbaA (DUF1428 family)/uncharacterized protein YndB with AHSA1/START domain
MGYVDGFIAAVPTANRDAFRHHSEHFGNLLQEFGAMRVVDCWGDDVPHGKLTDMHRAVQANGDETVCFSWIEWPSKELRDAGMARVMQDPRLQPETMQMPFDGKRMIFGGFESVSDSRRCTPPQGAADGHELSITRLIPVARDKLWRCWTEPQLLKQWFCPKPWGIAVAELDVRPGGFSHIVMRGPNGESHDADGVYLEVVPGRKLVFTDAFTRDWMPSGKPFMTGIVTFDDENGQTRYTARARHWTREDRVAHEQMGFEPGWNAAADQLEELAKTL